jgi:hypothetical protein
MSTRFPRFRDAKPILSERTPSLELVLRPMPDTVDSTESFLLVISVNRHPEPADCAQSGQARRDRGRKSCPILADQHNRAAELGGTAKTACVPTRNPYQEGRSHLGSSMID